MTDYSNYDFTKIPFDNLVRVGQKSMLYKDMFTVSWILGRYCNYKCSYCWRYGRSDKKDHRSKETCMNTIRSIKEQARERGFNSFHFSLSGGEPSLHPNYLEIVKELADDAYYCNWHSIHQTSNVSRPMSWLEKYCKLVSKFHLASTTASYHSEHADIKEFTKKLKMLQEYDINVTINMVMVPAWFDRDYETAQYFHDQKINVTLKPQSDHLARYVVDGYTEEQFNTMQTGFPQIDTNDIIEKGTRSKRPTFNMSGSNPPLEISKNMKDGPQYMAIEFVDKDGKLWWMDQAERFNAFDFNKFKGWECSSGYRSIIIREPGGDIKRSYSCHDEPIGTLENGFKLFDKPEPCITPSCVSSADSKIPKRKPGTKLPLFPGDETYV